MQTIPSNISLFWLAILFETFSLVLSATTSPSTPPSISSLIFAPLNLIASIYLALTQRLSPFLFALICIKTAAGGFLAFSALLDCFDAKNQYVSLAFLLLFSVSSVANLLFYMGLRPADWGGPVYRLEEC